MIPARVWRLTILRCYRVILFPKFAVGLELAFVVADVFMCWQLQKLRDYNDELKRLLEERACLEASIEKSQLKGNDFPWR